MALLPLAILAVIQGITEFLPISSSGHLIIGRQAMAAAGLPAMTLSLEQELAFDVAVHVGTLAAVLVYVRKDVMAICYGCFDAAGGRLTARARLAWNVVLASLPIAIVGFAAMDAVASLVRNPDAVLYVIAAASIGFGVLLWWADRRGVPEGYAVGGGSDKLASISAGDALVIGLAQMFALIPGASRAGVTMTAALFVNKDRRTAARFSFLLSIPAILGAGILLGRDVVAAGDLAFGVDAAVAMALAFATALAAMSLLMRWLARASFTPFVVYRILLGAVLLVWAVL